MRPSSPSLIQRFFTYINCRVFNHHDYTYVHTLTPTQHMLHSKCCNTFSAMSTETHSLLPFDQELDDMYATLDIDTKVIRHNYRVLQRLKHSQHQILKPSKHQRSGGAIADLLWYT
jgi:hypothetical protein